MKYDFTTILDRRGKDAIAVDAPDMESGFGADYFSKAKLKPGFDRIPMWVADMNFPTVPTIPEAIIERVIFKNCSNTEETADFATRPTALKYPPRAQDMDKNGMENAIAFKGRIVSPEPKQYSPIQGAP